MPSLNPSGARTKVRRAGNKDALDAMAKRRRRREAGLIKLRKIEQAMKKRREVLQGLVEDEDDGLTIQEIENVEKKIMQERERLEFCECLPSIIAGIWSRDSKLQLKTSTQFCQYLKLQPIKEVTLSCVVDRFVEFLGRDDFPQLQNEAVKAMKRITSISAQVVVDHGGAVPILVKLLESPNDGVRRYAVRALGNVAGNSHKCRDIVLRHGALTTLLAQLNVELAKPPPFKISEKISGLKMVRIASWTLSKFCSGRPRVFKQKRSSGLEFEQQTRSAFEQETRSSALPALRQLICLNDEQVMKNACWALSYMFDGTDDTIQAVIDAGFCARLVELLRHESPSVFIPALRVVCYISKGNDSQTQCIIDHGALQGLLSLLSGNHHDKKKSIKREDKKIIKREACRTISNITAGNIGQKQAVIYSGLLASLVNLLQTPCDEFDIKKDQFDIKKDAVCAISNAISVASREQIDYLVSRGCIKALCDLLTCRDPWLVNYCLEGLGHILKVGKVEKNHLGNTGVVTCYARLIDEAGGYKKIKRLGCYENTGKVFNEKVVKKLKNTGDVNWYARLLKGEAGELQMRLQMIKNLRFGCYENKVIKILEAYRLQEEGETAPPADGAQPAFSSGGSDVQLAVQTESFI